MAASKKQREEFFSSSTPQSQASIRDCIFDEGVDSGAPCAVPLADDFFANSAVICGSFMEGNSSFAKLLNTADTQELAVGSVFLVFATRWEIVFFQVQELRTVSRMRVYKMIARVGDSVHKEWTFDLLFASDWASMLMVSLRVWRAVKDKAAFRDSFLLATGFSVLAGRQKIHPICSVI